MNDVNAGIVMKKCQNLITATLPHETYPVIALQCDVSFISVNECSPSSLSHIYRSVQTRNFFSRLGTRKAETEMHEILILVYGDEAVTKR